MKINKTLTILSTFTVKNITLLFKYISYKSNSQSLLNLYQQLLVNFNKNLTIEQIQENVFSKSKNLVKTRRHLKEISEFAEQFIVQTIEVNRTKPSLKNELFIAKYYLHNQLIELAQAKIKSIDTILLNKQVINYEDFLLKYNVELLNAKIQVQTDKRIGDLNLGILNEDLDDFYVLRKLMHACSIIDRSKVVKQIVPIHTYLNEVISSPCFGVQLRKPIISFWFTILTLLQNPTKANFNSATQACKENINLIHETEMGSIFVYINNCIREIFKGKAFYEETYAIHQLQDKFNTLKIGSTFSPLIYKNMITVCLKLEKIKQAKTYLEKYKNDLPEANRQAYYDYNKAFIFFTQKKYESALDLLLPLKLEDIFYMLGAKRLSAMIYYEMYEIDLLESYLNAFSVYIFNNKKKLVTDRIKAHRNFINTLVKICYLQPKQWRKRKKLVQLVADFDFVSERQWLQQKLEELK